MHTFTKVLFYSNILAIRTRFFAAFDNYVNCSDLQLTCVKVSDEITRMVILESAS